MLSRPLNGAEALEKGFEKHAARRTEGCKMGMRTYEKDWSRISASEEARSLKKRTGTLSTPLDKSYKIGGRQPC
jgi:hypothetical protein